MFDYIYPEEDQEMYQQATIALGAAKESQVISTWPIYCFTVAFPAVPATRPPVPGKRHLAGRDTDKA